MLKTISKKRIKTTEANHVIDVTVNYKRDGKRGFYLNVSPIEIKGELEMYRGFTGYNSLLMTAERYSASKAKEAMEIAAKNESDLIRLVCKEQNLVAIM